MKKLLAQLKLLFASMLFRKSLVSGAILAVLTSLFIYLTASGAILATPKSVLPNEYAALAWQGKTFKAVELEQALRTGSKEVEEVIIFDTLKMAVAVGNGLEQDKIALQVDVDVIGKLTKQANIPVSTKPAVLETRLSERLSIWWFDGVIGLFCGFYWFLFFRRENKEEPSRARVFCEGVIALLEATRKRSKLSNRAFSTTILFTLLAINAVALVGKVYLDKNYLTIPTEIPQAQAIQPWQIAHHLQKRPQEFDRTIVVPELQAVYVALNTATPPPKLPGSETVEGTHQTTTPAPGKTYAAERTALFPDTAEGKAQFSAFVAELQKRNIAIKEVAATRNTDLNGGRYTTAGGIALVTLLTLTLLVIGVMTVYWADWEEEEPQSRKNTVGAGGRAAGQGRNAGTVIAEEDRKTFNDVAGCEEAITELKVVAKKIQRPKLYKVFGAPVPAGVILFGPPGTGKTLLARALAGEIGGHFDALSGSEFVEMYVGVGAKRVREAYAKARAEARRRGRISIIFIDEIDAIAKKRGQGDGGGDKEYEQTLNQLLTEMQGFGNHGLVLTMAATNRLDILDDAILRPGRFDIKVKVPLPDKKGRAQVYGVYLKKLNVVLKGSSEQEKEAAKAQLIDDLARRSHDFSGAMIEGALKNAATIAVERQFGDVTDDITDAQFEEYKQLAIITVDDLNEGVDKMAYGTQIKSRVRTDKERWATAVHECGHGAVPTICGGDPVNRITIIMTEKSLGLMDSSPEEGERYDWTDEQFKIRLQMMLAGRAAEKVLLGKVSTGASNDFERASTLARQMVGIYGMSVEFGVKSLPLDQYGFPMSRVGEILLDKFNQAWGNLIDRMEAETDALIEAHRSQIEACAQALFEEETLTGDEFRRIWQENAVSA